MLNFKFIDIDLYLSKFKSLQEEENFWKKNIQFSFQLMILKNRK